MWIIGSWKFKNKKKTVLELLKQLSNPKIVCLYIQRELHVYTFVIQYRNVDMVYLMVNAILTTKLI